MTTNTFLWTDAAVSNLASALAASTGATSIALTPGTGTLFPSPSAGQQFALFIRAASGGSAYEVCYCTAVTGDTLTVARAQEGTSAQAWAIGDIVTHGLTSGTMQAMAQTNVTPTFSQLQAQQGNWATDSGTANAAVVTLSPVPASLTAIKGAPIVVLKTSAANTGAVTINVNGLGVKSVVLPGGGALVAGMLPASGFFTVTWDGTNFELQSVTFSPTFTGDSGSGGVKGLVPAPSAGSSALGQVLLASGAFGAPIHWDSSTFSYSSAANGSFTCPFTPSNTSGFFQVTTAFAEFNIGDIVPFFYQHDTGGDHGLPTWWNGTTVKYQFGSSVPLYTNASGDSANIPTADVVFFIRAWP